MAEQVFALDCTGLPYKGVKCIIFLLLSNFIP